MTMRACSMKPNQNVAVLSKIPAYQHVSSNFTVEVLENSKVLSGAGLDQVEECHWVAHLL
jgi:hypothetical protein